MTCPKTITSRHVEPNQLAKTTFWLGIRLRILGGSSFTNIGHRLAIGTDGARKRFDRAFEEFAAWFAAEYLREGKGGA
jgi:hypothetical protein